eukprot:6358513-Amphidinium_carterae.1
MSNTPKKTKTVVGVADLRSTAAIVEEEMSEWHDSFGQYKWRSKRVDLFAPSSTSNTSRVIDLLAVKKQYYTCTADATRAFFHVPQDEVCHAQPPVEWIAGG